MIESLANLTGGYGFSLIIFDSLKPNFKDWYNKKVFSETFDIFNFKYVIWLEFLKTRYLYNSSL